METPTGFGDDDEGDNDDNVDFGGGNGGARLLSSFKPTMVPPPPPPKPTQAEIDRDVQESYMYSFDFIKIFHVQGDKCTLGLHFADFF